MRKYVLVAAVAAMLTGCDDSTGPAGASQVALQFAAAPSVVASTGQMPLGLGGPGVASVVVEGSNGTLRLDEIHVIVDEFELERTEDLAGCDDSDGMDDDACEEFEAGPLFMELDLDSGPTTVATAAVPPGTYDELEFEIEDLEDEGDDDGERQRIAALLTEIRTQFPAWPREASMRVVGEYTPSGGEPEPFVAYFEAEVEIELEFDTPFVVTEDDVSRTITVELNPGAWFTRSDGSVRNLALLDYETTGQVVEFEFEMEHGFERVEHDDDDDDHDDD